MASPRVRAFAMSLYPRFYNVYKKGIEKGMASHPQWLISILTKGNGDEAMRWWLSGKMLKEYYQAQYEITGIRKGRQIEWTVKPNKLSFGLIK